MKRTELPSPSLFPCGAVEPHGPGREAGGNLKNYSNDNKIDIQYQILCYNYFEGV
jgi:hypothetical protein